MPFGDMLEDVGNWAIKGAQDLGNQMPAVHRLVPGEYTPPAGADRPSQAGEWEEAGGQLLGAIGAGVGAFGARIAGGEQGFIAYMNNMAKQEAAEDQRSHENKLHRRAEAFRKEMLELEHGWKVDAAGREIDARKELQGLLLESQEIQTGMRLASSEETARLGRDLQSRLSKKEIRARADQAEKDRESREDIAADKLWMETFITPQTNLDDIASREKVASKRLKAEMRLRRMDKELARAKTLKELRRLVDNEITKPDALLGIQAKVAQDMNLPLDMIVDLSKDGNTDFLRDAYANSFIDGGGPAALTAEIIESRRVEGKKSANHIFLQQWQDAGHPQTLNNGKPVNLNAAPAAVLEQMKVAVETSPEYKKWMDGKSKLTRVLNSLKALGQGSHANTSPQEWARQRTTLTNKKTEFEALDKSHGELRNMPETGDLFTAIEDEMATKMGVIDGGTVGAANKKASTQGADVTNPGHIVNKLGVELNRAATLTEFMDAFKATAKMDDLGNAWKYLRDLSDNDFELMGEEKDADVVALHKLLSDEAQNASDPEEFLRDLWERQSALIAKNPAADGSFFIDDDYRNRLQIWKNLNDVKFSPTTIGDSISVGKGERKKRQQEKSLRYAADGFMNRVMRQIGPVSGRGKGFLSLFTEKEFDGFFHAKNIDDRAFHLDEKGDLQGNPNVLHDLSVQTADRLVTRIRTEPSSKENALGTLVGVIDRLQKTVKNGTLKGSELQMVDALIPRLIERKGLLMGRINPTAVSPAIPPNAKIASTPDRAKTSVDAVMAISLKGGKVKTSVVEILDEVASLVRKGNNASLLNTSGEKNFADLFDVDSTMMRKRGEESAARQGWDLGRTGAHRVSVPDDWSMAGPGRPQYPKWRTQLGLESPGLIRAADEVKGLTTGTPWPGIGSSGKLQGGVHEEHMGGMSFIGTILEGIEQVKALDLSKLSDSNPDKARLQMFQNFFGSAEEQVYLGNYGQSFRDAPQQWRGESLSRQSAMAAAEERVVTGRGADPRAVEAQGRAIGEGELYPGMKQLLTQNVPAIDLTDYIGDGPITDTIDVREVADSFYAHVTDQEGLDSYMAEITDMQSLVDDVRAALKDAPEGGLQTLTYGQYALPAELMQKLDAEGTTKGWWDARDLDIIEGIIKADTTKHKRWTFEKKMAPQYATWVSQIVFGDVVSNGSLRTTEGEEGEMENVTWGGDIETTMTADEIANGASYRVEQLGDKTMMADMAEKAGVETQRGMIAAAVKSAPPTMKRSEAIFQALKYQNLAYNAGDIAPTPLNLKDEKAAFGDKFITQLRATHREMYMNPEFIKKGRDSWPGPVRNYLPKDFNDLSIEDRAIMVIGAFTMLSTRGKISGSERHGAEQVKPLSWWEHYDEW